MQSFDDLNRRLGNSSLANSSLCGKVTFFSATGQQSLDNIGGEPLAGSGFENEEPESEFAPYGEESRRPWQRQ
ncbi:MAG: hypothetical protein DMG57_31180 [Acidobacteria bacterium]|nr:MAG: hypothetical protein DMG57_31180 [Acidobacteriota bacterium]